MAHEWHAGILNQSSWHGLESVESIPDAETMIRRGLETGAWPLEVCLEDLITSSGLPAPGSAVVAAYQDGSRVAHGTVGDRYTPLDPKEWRATVEAACRAGARPAGAFSLRGGSRLLATFEIPGNGGKIRNFLCLADALDGSLKHLAGGTSIRVVCANTMRAAMNRGRGGFTGLRHTASINDRTEALRDAIEAHVTEGQAVSALYREARRAELTRPEAEEIFSQLFPEPTEEQRQKRPRLATRLINSRSDAARAMKRPENYEGRSLATIWNAATWLVDRTPDGKARKARGGADRLDSLLFGSRGKRIEEVRNVIEVVLADGTTAEMEAPEAASHGVDEQQIGRQVLEGLLAD